MKRSSIYRVYNMSYIVVTYSPILKGLHDATSEEVAKEDLGLRPSIDWSTVFVLLYLIASVCILSIW